MPATLLFISSNVQPKADEDDDMPSEDLYPECATCINREYDPFECESCTEASNYEEESDEEELSYPEFIDLFRDAA